jgi:hypothetical protein
MAVGGLIGDCVCALLDFKGWRAWPVFEGSRNDSLNADEDGAAGDMAFVLARGIRTVRLRLRCALAMGSGGREQERPTVRCGCGGIAKRLPRLARALKLEAENGGYSHRSRPRAGGSSGQSSERSAMVAVVWQRGRTVLARRGERVQLDVIGRWRLYP